MINATQNAGSAASQTSSSGTAKNTALDSQDRFLKLLVTQMKNQDPLNPMDNAEVTSQMAQLSTVSGIDRLNTTVQALSDSMAAGQAVAATSMIGHGIMVPGSTLNLVNGQAIGGLDMAQPADSVNVTIKDTAGNIVRTLHLGAQKSGVLPLTWDGRTDAGALAADGAYKFTAGAVLAGRETAAATLAFGMVSAVTPGAKGTTLEVGQLGGFALSAVKQVM